MPERSTARWARRMTLRAATVLSGPSPCWQARRQWLSSAMTTPHPPPAMHRPDALHRDASGPLGPCPCSAARHAWQLSRASMS